jgi:prepilin-type N-terminal cleavage/methylation domain-containing protein
MNYKLRTNKAFTMIELLVAVGILAIVISFAGVIFKVSINAHRTAIANAEIMQKLRAITNQLNADFKGLRKDGEIFMIWMASPVPAAGYKDSDLDGYERFDRIMFFADGDFHSYKVNPMVRGNVARICYILARQGGIRAQWQNRTKRILARTQHILTADPALAGFLDPDNFSDAQWYQWNNRYEYDKMSLEAWKIIPWQNKADMLSVITDIRIGNNTVNEQFRGAMVDPADPNSIHMLMCEGVGEFMIQGWYDAQQRWVPEVDPDGDGDLTDTHFFLVDSNSVPGVLYPFPTEGAVVLGGEFYCDLDTQQGIDKFQALQALLNEERFGEIPGLGRALKFTFTLYDSKGIIKEGRTFTHIVYLDN